MYTIVTIEFKDWNEYEEKVNRLCSQGLVIDETISKSEYGYGIKNEHVFRMKKNIL